MQKIRKNQIVAGEAWLRERAGLVLATLGIGSFHLGTFLLGLVGLCGGALVASKP